MKRPFLLVMTILIAGCVSADQYADERERAEQIAAERDSLVAEVLATAALINQIQLELSEVSDTSLSMALPSEEGLSSRAEENEVALAKIRAAIEQLERSQAEIETQRERIASLSSSQSTLLARVAEYETTIEELRAGAERRAAEYEAIITQQRTMIAGLARQVDTARAQNEVLALENVILTDSVEALSNIETTVYYIAGTKDELEEQGVVVNEGKKFLFFGSKTLQPARNLDPDAFTAIDKHEITTIRLPEAERDYKILTRQNPEYLAALTEKGAVRDSLTIAAPDAFWAGSRFLILVRN
jgi:hypothetical protein